MVVLYSWYKNFIADESLVIYLATWQTVDYPRGHGNWPIDYLLDNLII